MHIGIIGAGFTGLSAAYELQKLGHRVTLLEKESQPGGLAVGFKKPNWEWSLEKHYHHIFTGDTAIQKVGKEIGVSFTFSQPNVSWFIDDQICQIDSPLRLLLFSKLSVMERLRMSSVLGYLKLTSNWQSLEKTTAYEWLPKMMGRKAFKMFWEPLLTAKFGDSAKDISLAWFWARIKSRSALLGYPEGGFQNFVDKMAEKIVDQKGTIHYDTNVQTINQDKEKIFVKTDTKKLEFERLIVTLPNIFFAKMAPQLPDDYKRKLLDFKGMGAVNMVIELKKPFFSSDVYWLSVCDNKYPFVAVVEHTNYIDPSHYNNHHLVYVGNYLNSTHRYFSISDDAIFKEYEPYLAKLSPNFKKNLISKTVFRAQFAQPIVTVNFSEKILPFETPLRNVYLTNMQQVYPWDRQTNYAVAMGKEVAELIYFLA